MLRSAVMLYYLVATLYVLACFLLLLVVLLQQGKGGDIASAFGGGGSQTAFGARAGATVLTRATAVLGAIFMIGAVLLAVLGRPGSGSLMRGTAAPAPPPVQTPLANPATNPDTARAGASTAADSAAAAAARAGTGQAGRRRDAAEAGREPEVAAATIAASVRPKHYPTSRKWRNWQTHQLEGLALAITWGFESPLSHHLPTKNRDLLAGAARLAAARTDIGNDSVERSRIRCRCSAPGDVQLYRSGAA